VARCVYSDSQAASSHARPPTQLPPIPDLTGSASPTGPGYRTFDVSSNNFTGPIPDSIGNLAPLNLAVIGLEDNLFNGTVPASYMSLTTMTYVHLENNQLIGEIPDFSNFTNMANFRMSNNNLNGSLPCSLATRKTLRTVQLDHNQLSGSIPECWRDFYRQPLQLLSLLVLNTNSLSGTIPSWLGNMGMHSGIPHTISVDLSNNFLTGASSPNLLGSLEAPTTSLACWRDEQEACRRRWASSGISACTTIA